MRSLAIFAVVSGLIMSGCKDQATTPPVVSTQQEDLPSVAHPEYAHWSQFPIGSTTVRKKEVTNENGKVLVTTTIKLIAKDEKQVVVESQITVERGSDPIVVNPPFTAEYPATFRLPKNMTIDQFQLPSLKAKLVGEEELTVLGKQYKAQKFSWQETNEAGPMDLVVWRVDGIPGRTAREESLTGSLQNKSLEEVIEIVIPEQGPGETPKTSG